MWRNTKARSWTSTSRARRRMYPSTTCWREARALYCNLWTGMAVYRFECCTQNCFGDARFMVGLRWGNTGEPRLDLWANNANMTASAWMFVPHLQYSDEPMRSSSGTSRPRRTRTRRLTRKSVRKSLRNPARRPRPQTRGRGKPEGMMGLRSPRSLANPRVTELLSAFCWLRRAS